MLQDQPNPDSSTASLTAEKLRRRYLVALTLIALLTILSQLVVQVLILDQEYDSRVVNIAGRQRMLSQSITKTALYIAEADSPQSSLAYRQELDSIVTRWERSHLGLLHGDAGLGLPGRNSDEIIGLFKKIDPEYQAMVKAARHLIAAAERGDPINQDIQGIRDHEARFLQGMDDIVSRYDREAEYKVSVASGFEFFLMGVTLLVLTLEALFIFAPVTRRIRHDMRVLEKKEESMSRLFSVSPSAMLLVDNMNLSILRVNQQTSELIGETPENIVKENLRKYLDPSLETNHVFFEKIIKKEPIKDYEADLIDVRNTVFRVLVSVQEIFISGREVLVLGMTNISELKKAQQTLEHHATFDEMTGLVNRRTGLMVLRNSMAQSKRDHRQLCVCFADLDGLKTANDNYGHAEGDWLLRTVAETLASSIRAGDVAVRLGGDEFLLVLHDCPIEDARRLLTRVEDRLSAISIQEDKPFRVSVSYGITAYDPERHSKTDELIADADALMYRAKQKKKFQTPGAGEARSNS